MESMACGTPIICSDAGGGKDVLDHMKNAWIIKSQNPDELYSSIIELLNNNEKRKLLSKNGYKSALQYDWKKIGQDYLKLYNDILNSN